MQHFFSIIYVKPNRHSEEKIAVGIVGSINKVPFVEVNTRKLNFALRSIHESLRPLIRKSLRLLAFDVNKYRNGEDTLPLFDEVISERLLRELSQNKRGKVIYGELFNLSGGVSIQKVADKYIGKIT